MLETITALVQGAGPADDAVAGSIRTPVAVPAVFAVPAVPAVAAVHGVGIAPAADRSSSSSRRRMAIHHSPMISIDRGIPGSKTRAAGEFSLAFVRIGHSRLCQCSRAGQGGYRNND